MKLQDKVALVTGASRGIGRAIAERLAAEGALVAVHFGSKPADAEATVRAIRDAGGDAFPIGADVGSVADIKQLFTRLDAELIERTGAARFDILVNNAGVAPPLSIEETTEKDFDKIYGINVKGVFFLVQAALPRLRDGGRIINVSTGLTRSGIANPGYAAYASSKGAVNVLTTLLAKALGPRGITVNALAPGVTDTGA